MSTLAISLVATPDWEDRVDQLARSVSEAAQVVQSAVTRERAVLKFYFSVRVLNANVSEFLASLDKATQGLQDGTLGAVASDDEQVNPVEIIRKMALVYRILNGLYELATLGGLKKRLLTRGEVRKLHDLSERLFDYVVWLEDAATQESRQWVDAHFADALAELQSRETVPFR
jgi:hypothetical protein